MSFATHIVSMPTSPPTPQSGIALPMVLIFLVIMMVISATSVRNGILEEKMASNARSQQLAFQAAEQALRYCETKLQIAPFDAINDWITIPAARKPEGVKSLPRCCANDISDFVPLQPDEVSRDLSNHILRITAEGTGVTDDAKVRLESTLKFKK